MSAPVVPERLTVMTRRPVPSVPSPFAPTPSLTLKALLDSATLLLALSSESFSV